jgi:colanic acid/amylovoran biosynthesis protein
MTQIVITGHTSFANRGNEALIRSTTRLIAEELTRSGGTDAPEFTVFSLTPESDRSIYGDSDPAINFLPLNFNPAVYYRKGKIWYAARRYLKLAPRSFLRIDETSYQAVKNADCLLISGGDLLAGYGLDAMRQHSFLALTAAAIGVPTVIFAHSFNPYKTAAELDFARFLLNQVSLITVRESLSLEYLKSIGVKTPLLLSADPAFWLESASEARSEQILAQEGVPSSVRLAGISASTGMARYVEGAYEQYISALAELADYLGEQHGLHVLLIPHVIGERRLGGDDRVACQDVIQKMRSPQFAHSIEGEYNAQELKGLISRCQIFTGSRMHSAVAACSSLVPTIGLAYSVKTHGVLGEVIKSRPVVFDVATIDSAQLKATAYDLLTNRHLVIQEMKENLDPVRDQARISAAQCIALTRKPQWSGTKR